MQFISIILSYFVQYYQELNLLLFPYYIYIFQINTISILGMDGYGDFNNVPDDEFRLILDYLQFTDIANFRCVSKGYLFNFLFINISFINMYYLLIFYYLFT